MSHLWLPILIVFLSTQRVRARCIVSVAIESFGACCAVVAVFDFVPMRPAVVGRIQTRFPFSSTCPVKAVVPASRPDPRVTDDGKERIVGAFLLFEALVRLAMTLSFCIFIVMSLSTVLFFCTAAFARLSKPATSWFAKSPSIVFPAKPPPPPVIFWMSWFSWRDGTSNGSSSWPKFGRQ